MFDFGRNKDMTENNLLLKQQKETSIRHLLQNMFSGSREDQRHENSDN